MTKSAIRKGLRVEFTGPRDGIAPLFDAASHKLIGMKGGHRLRYQRDPTSDTVWVAFDGDRMPRR